MTAAQRHPSEPHVQFRPAPYPPLRPPDPQRKARLVLLWLHLIACLVVWPAVFGTVVIATFVGLVVVYNDSAGPLFWPLAWVVTAIAYGLVVGIPLAICGRRRRWYLRLIPVVTAAASLVWLGILIGIGTIPATETGLLWLIPSIATVALSILVQMAPWWRLGTGRVPPDHLHLERDCPNVSLPAGEAVGVNSHSRL